MPTDDCQLNGVKRNSYAKIKTLTNNKQLTRQANNVGLWEGDTVPEAALREVMCSLCVYIQTTILNPQTTCHLTEFHH